MKRSSSISFALVGTAILVTACSSSSGGSGADGTSLQAVDAATCNQMQKCDPFSIQARYGDVNTCISALNAFATAALPGQSFTSADVQACADAINAADCSTSFDDLPACRVKGTLANGAGCADPTQCSTGSCQFTDDTSDCGKCAPVAADGSACTQDDDCNIGSGCDPTKAVCGPRPAKGAACTPTGIDCQGNSVCIANLCSDPLPDGAACDSSNDQCGPTSQCINSKCAAVSSFTTIAEVGQACGVDQTAAKQTVCKFSSCVSSKCVAFAAEGQPCAADDGAGAVAATAPDCVPGLTCVSGTCSKAPPLTCQ